MQREKRTYSGRLFEVDFYPVFDDGRKILTRAPKEKPSTEEQQRYNRLKAVKKLVRLVNANFDSSDYWLHPTYRPECAPQDEKEARRDMVNFLRRVKTRRAAEAKKLREDLLSAQNASRVMPGSKFLDDEVKRLKKQIEKLEAPLKYIYVIEKQTYRRGKYAGRTNWHFHAFITGGLDRGTLEEMWGFGVSVNCDRFQPERFGFESAALYMSKDPQGAKRYSYSRNLEKPVEKHRDGKVSRKTVEKMATVYFENREYWETRYKGYTFLRCYARYNVYNGHYYVSAVMYKSDGTLPKWEVDDWITEDFA